jgi:hypothetical protein
VHADVSAGEPAMRDSARFHFGFTVPFEGRFGAASVIAALDAAPGDLALVPATTAAAAWWAALEPSDAPKIIARLPFIERADHPAGLPVFAIARPHPDALVNDVSVWSMRVSGWSLAAAQAVGMLAESVAVSEGAYDGAALLISVPADRTIEAVHAALVGAGASVRSQALVGGHARRYTVSTHGVAGPSRR